MSARGRAASGEDRISTLQDGVLHLVLFHLPSDEAVQTCVLARRWRHLWKSSRAIRIGPHHRNHCGPHREYASDEWTPRTLSRFMNHLLLLRGYSAVDVCDIRCCEAGEEMGEDGDYYSDDRMSACISKRAAQGDLSVAAGLWIRHAVFFCKARVLRVSIRPGNRLRIPDVPFVSQTLTRVEIADAKLRFGTLDFSKCPALEVLEFSNSRIEVGRILSPSLSRLKLDECNFTGDTRTRISTPRLVSLHVTVASGCVPSLEDDMPMLVAAEIRIQDDLSNDMCVRKQNKYLSCHLKGCYECKGVEADGGVSVLFQGLSGATDLELASDPRAFIFRRDCQFCTIFRNLKTLLLNEWCMTPDFGALVYFLRYTPVLEKLILQLEYCAEERLAVTVTDELCSPKEDFLVSKRLDVVKIKCQEENELVGKILEILQNHGVPREKINIKKNFRPPCTDGYDTNDSDYGEYW